MNEEAHLQALLLKGLAGDEAAHRAFLTQAGALLRAFFRNRLRSMPEDVEDLVQETLVALHVRRDSYDANYPLTAWMYSIARYRLIDLWRRQRRRGRHNSLDDLELGAIDPVYEAGEAKRDVFRLLNTLPAKQKAAIQLVKLEEKSVKEASEITGFTESDIKISIHRGLKALQQFVEGQELARVSMA
jgi:RNA polymerase sigma-70 factor (ECF subfamily)